MIMLSDGILVMFVMMAILGIPSFFYLIIAYIKDYKTMLLKMSKKKYVLWMIVYILLEVLCITFVITILTSGYLSL